MTDNLTSQNLSYWQNYKPGEIPSVPKNPPQTLLESIHGPVLDVGTGDGILAEYLASKGHQVYGVDIAKNIILEDQKRHSKVNYSVADITRRTSFLNHHFDLILFKFTLTNIHRDSWPSLGNEVSRILSPGGKVWILEPLVSDSYQKRYQLASDFVIDKNCVYVFRDPKTAENINTKENLQNAIDQNLVSRIVKHYTVDELKSIFSDLTLASFRTIKVTSPSGYIINTFEGVFGTR